PSPPPWTLVCHYATHRSSPGTQTPEPPSTTTEPAATSTATASTSSPPTWPACKPVRDINSAQIGAPPGCSRRRDYCKPQTAQFLPNFRSQMGDLCDHRCGRCEAQAPYIRRRQCPGACYI